MFTNLRKLSETLDEARRDSDEKFKRLLWEKRASIRTAAEKASRGEEGSFVLRDNHGRVLRVTVKKKQSSTDKKTAATAK